MSLLLGADFHKLTSVVIEVSLELLELTTLFEQSFGSGSALILEDLLFLEVSSLGSADEFVSVVLIPHLQVVQSVCQSLDFLLTLAELSVELVSVPLQLFLLLSSFDYVVSLRVLTAVVSTLLVPLDEAFVLNPEVLDPRLSVHELYGYFVPLLFSSFGLRDQDILMNLNFLLTLLHRHFELVLSVLKSKDAVSLHIDCVSELLNLELFAVVLNEGFLFVFLDFFEVVSSHLILQLELLNLSGQVLALVSHFIDNSLNVPLLVHQLLIGNHKHVELLLLLVELCLGC